MNSVIPRRLSQAIDQLHGPLKAYKPLVTKALERLFDQAAKTSADGSVYLSTGDIPAMWLRDSSFQIKPLLRFSRDIQIYRFCAGVIKQQAKFIMIDPYANAFNPEPNGNCWHKDFADQSPWVFERKWEIDSLASFFDISAALVRFSGRKEHLDETWQKAAQLALNTLMTEQKHVRDSYRFVRPGAPAHDHLSNDGFGAAYSTSGLVWSAFRPSDDACELPFNIPQNAYACAAVAAVRKYLPKDLRLDAKEFAKSVRKSIEQLAKSRDGYTYEIDGLGNQLFMDDANFPSLLALPYLGYCSPTSRAYLKTRRRILSSENPWYFSGDRYQHVGSPHTGLGQVWPLAMAMEIITSHKVELKKLSTLASTASQLGNFHESVSVNETNVHTRDWFSWADMTFADAVFTTAERLYSGSDGSDATVVLLSA